MVYGIIIAVIFGCYVLSSFILFKYPCLLHKRKNVKFVCRHISHRGGAGENYENTMTAFRHAVSLGTEMLELDVHLTRDELVVVAHDPDLRRTDVRGNIADLNYSELPQLKESVTVDFMPGCTFSRPSEPDRRMPLLETVFQNFPHTPINIDIKVPNDLLIIKVSELVKRYKREHLTVWGNFSETITQRCYKEVRGLLNAQSVFQNPNICLLFSLKRVLLLVLQMYSGLLPFMPLKETHLEIFMPLHVYKLYLLKAPAMDPAEAKRPGSPLHSVSNFNFGIPNSSAAESPSRNSVLVPPSSASPAGASVPKGPWYLRTVASLAHMLLIRPALFSHLAKRGIQTYLWVLNSEEEYHQAFKSGATGVMTDYPTKLKAFLAENPQYLQNYPHVTSVEQEEPEATSANHLLPDPTGQPKMASGTANASMNCSSDSLAHSSSRNSLSDPDETQSWSKAEASDCVTTPVAERRSSKSLARAGDDATTVRSLSPSFASTASPQVLVAEGL